MIRSSEADVIGVRETDSLIHLSNGMAELEINLADGGYSAAGTTVLAWKEIRSAFRWNGREYHTGHYDRHMKKEEPETVQDGFGTGIHLTIVHESDALPALEQHFWIYENSPFFLTRVVLSGEADLKCNRLTVLRTNGVALEQAATKDDELHVLRVPYDNDKWVRYVTETAPLDTESYEVTALFQPHSRRGLIVGSLSHNVWKTGIRVKSEKPGTLDEFECYAGAAGEMTRDTQPHGYVHGPRVESPLVFVGFYDDYRAGMEAYGRANEEVAPSLTWEGGVPFGWNSWSAAMSSLDYELYTATSDFLKRETQERGFQNEGTLYINFDAFGDNLTPAEMEDALARVRQNGHKPGTYWTPFAFWGSPAQFGESVEGTDGKYTYADILLRDHEGEILADIAGGLAIDPTHPGTLARMDWFAEKFIAEGFEYIKLDFMAHGALEGKHHRPDITTGIAAYHYGLSYLAARLSPEAAGRPVFINLSIAPLFPYAFAHSRRISCDVFGKIEDTEYLLNSLTHGWWMNGTLYRFNDPDHSVLYKSFNQDPTTRHEGRSRLTASVISGTVLLLGDDFRQEEAAWRAKEWLANPDILELARLGQTFVPVEGNRGKHASEAFLLTHPNDPDSVYLAVFNFDADSPAQKSVAMERLGLDQAAFYQVYDLWEGMESEAGARVTVSLEPAESKILKLSRKRESQ
ncbi:alpha-galactosidase [Paenibacillus sp. HJL G12]|uniref:Alpha-galactosidase n=1 Tax=Paenibacillus dendrobii TaxID=2691084 RepID=A0A7X3LJG9_9BACL|nr:alpha-galactosidase [Paenibacillus dendrobii]MWV47212.1 alpha-galactosidase [Paenibacillus dendrobii]